MKPFTVAREVPFGVRQFRKLLGVCLLQDAINEAMEMLSSVLAGNFLGEEALAGVALALPVQLVGWFFSSLIGGGMLTNYLLRRGRLDREGAESVFSQAVGMAILCGIAMSAVVGFGGDAYIAFMAPSPAVAEAARAFWRYLPLFALLSPISIVMFFSVIGDGAGKLAGAACAARLVAAVGVSYVLLSGGYGTASCSLGLVSGTVVFAAVLATHYFAKDNTFRLRFTAAVTAWRPIVTSAFGDASATLGDALVVFLLGKSAVAAMGPSALALVPVALLVVKISDVSSGIPEGMQPVITVYAGEGNMAAMRQLVRAAMKLIVAFSAVVTALLLLFPDAALALLGIRDPELLASGAVVVRLSALAIFPMVFANFLNNYYQCIEHEGVSMLTSMLVWFAFPVAALFLFRGAGPDCFWLWLAAAKWGGAAALMAFVFLRFGRTMFPWLLDRGREREQRVFSFELEPQAVVDAAMKVANQADAVSDHTRAMRASLLVEETLMVVKERNAGRKVRAEVTLDWHDGLLLTLRDDGVIFDITDSDAQVSGLRTYLVASMMERHSDKQNLLTTGFNRNVFKL